MIRDRGLEEHVTLLGERQDVGALLHAADLFVFPSIYEGLGNALLEAMAAGKPCVVSRIPPLREVTGDGTVALLAEPRSAADLAANLLRLATDPGLAARLGTAARA
jgi:glycosyltransferase involved in cell wall biosynthesis